MTKQLLVEQWGPIRLKINESKSKDGRLVAEGEFGFCGKPTANGRIYPRSLVEREINRLGGKMKIRGLYGELDHPSDGATKLKRVSHLITNLRVESDGRVIGEMEVLPTPNGQILRSIVESGAQVGVSSRGVGSVKKTREGNFEVQEDFKLLTYDAVADPAWGDALPEYRFEDENEEGTVQTETETEDEMAAETIEELEKTHPELVAKIRSEEREKTSEVYKQRLAEQRRKMESEVADSLEKLVTGTSARAREQALEEVLQSEPAGVELEAIQRIKDAVAPLINEDEEVETLAQRIIQLEAANQSLQNALLNSEKGRVVQAHLACIPESHQDHFLNLLGPIDHFDAVDEFRERADFIAEEFRQTGRYVDNVEQVAGQLEEAVELLSESREALQHKNDLLADAKEAIIKIERSSLRRATQLDEAKETIAELEEKIGRTEDKIQDLKESYESKVSQLREQYEDRMVELEDQLTEAELSLHKHRKVIGHSKPETLLQRLEEANDPDRVDRIVESEQQERRPVDPPVGATSNGSRDPLNEDTIRNRIEAVLEADPVNVGVQTGVMNESTGSPGRFQIPGLSPNDMKKLTDSQGHFIPGD